MAEFSAKGQRKLKKKSFRGIPERKTTTTTTTEEIRPKLINREVKQEFSATGRWKNNQVFALFSLHLKEVLKTSSECKSLE